MMTEKSGTLLIAERGGALSQNLDFWITEQGHRLKAVDNIKDLLMTLQSEKINVLVMDVRLPEDMGYEAISIIKGLDRKLPIIITADENNAGTGKPHPAPGDFLLSCQFLWHG